MKMGESGRTIYLAIIGLGGRGRGQMKTLLQMPDVKVRVVCDVYKDRIELAQKEASEIQGFIPDGDTDYRRVVARDDIDAVVVMTSWTTHITICVAAMRAGKRVAMEVGGAASIDECWRLVRTSEETGIPCMLLENCCYNNEEMALLNMVRQGVFGELVHCQGGYEHDLRDEIGNGDIIRHYRQDNFLKRNGELYPTHELGPIAKYLNINRGNRMVSLVAMSSKAAGLKAWLKENRPDDEITQQPINEGDIVTTLIKCANGETIVLTHDCTSPRPYSRGGRVQGTKGLWMEDNRSIYVEGAKVDPADDSSEPIQAHKWAPDAAWMKAYQHPLWKEYEEFGLRGGHGGMDYLVLRAFVESVQNQTAVPIDVYDAAAWMCVTALSEQSIAMGSMPVPVPDFTDGEWIHRKGEVKGRYALDEFDPSDFSGRTVKTN